MEFKATTIFQQNAQALKDGKRRALNEGGTSSSKTYSILQILILIARSAKTPTLISIVSESLPHLKRGCIRDFLTLLGDTFDDKRWNRSEFVYDFGQGKIEFFSADVPSKMRGGRRKYLFINEANNVSYDAYRELDIRTEIFTFLDWNPVSEFWAHEYLKGKPENVFIHSTWRDAAWVIPQATIENIHIQALNDPNWGNVYDLGNVGKVEGLVYPRFEQIDSLPERGDIFYGLDFGYSNDPSVLTRNMIIGDCLYSQELFYESGLTNDAISHKMDELGVKRGHDEIFADAAEPKSIQEIYQYGFNIKPCPKGADSVEHGHQKLRQFKHYWTKDSLKCIKEQRNFRYIPDKDGKYTDKTTHDFSHGMDSRRYGVMGYLNRRDYGFSFTGQKVIVDADF